VPCPSVGARFISPLLFYKPVAPFVVYYSPLTGTKPVKSQLGKSVRNLKPENLTKQI